jgi:hypothetical protein
MLPTQFGDFNPKLCDGMQGMASPGYGDQVKVQEEGLCWEKGPGVERQKASDPASPAALNDSNLNQSDGTDMFNRALSLPPHQGQAHHQQPASGLSSSSTSLIAPSSLLNSEHAADSFASSATTIMPDKEKLGEEI